MFGQLSSRHVVLHASAEAEQIRAWEREIEILKIVLTPCVSGAWSILPKVLLLRLAKRLDAVLLGPGLVVVIEFKTRAGSFAAPDRLQTERYGQSLRDFHEVSQSRLIVSPLCAELTLSPPLRLSFTDGVLELIRRHLINQLTDAVAMSVLDPFEVYEIEVSPLPFPFPSLASG